MVSPVKLACFRAREECGDTADIPLTANALKWIARHYHRHCSRVGINRCHHIGVDLTGSDGVDANIVWRQSQGGGFRQLHDTSLRRAISSDGRNGDLRIDG